MATSTWVWTPYQIKLLLHYFACCDDFPPAPILQTEIDYMIERGLMTRDGARPPQTATLTDRGRAFVELGLLQTQLPVWRMP